MRGADRFLVSAEERGQRPNGTRHQHGVQQKSGEFPLRKPAGQHQERALAQDDHYAGEGDESNESEEEGAQHRAMDGRRHDVSQMRGVAASLRLFAHEALNRPDL